MARLLLDTHVLLFAFAAPRKLGQTARALIADSGNEIYFSPVSTWEIAVKHAKHPEDMPISANRFLEYCDQAGYREAMLCSRHIRALEHIDGNRSAPIHSDPFDRMLLCQAMTDEMMLLTRDRKLLAYGERCIVDAR